jgi:glutaredoxin
MEIPMKGHHLKLITAVTLCLLTLGSPVSAFDLGGFVKDIASGQSAEDILRDSIQSITETQLGQLPDGMTLPGRGDVITMYATEWCGYCKQARAYFKKERIFVVEKDIDKSSAARAEARRLGSTGGVPFFVAGTQTLGGWSEGAFKAFQARFQEERASKQTVPAPATETNRANSAAAASPEAAAGAILRPKINGTKVYRNADKSGPVLVALKKSDDLVFLGEKRKGMLKIACDLGEGWVDEMLLQAP